MSGNLGRILTPWRKNSAVWGTSLLCSVPGALMLAATSGLMVEPGTLLHLIAFFVIGLTSWIFLAGVAVRLFAHGRPLLRVTGFTYAASAAIVLIVASKTPSSWDGQGYLAAAGYVFLLLGSALVSIVIASFVFINSRSDEDALNVESGKGTQ